MEKYHPQGNKAPRYDVVFYSLKEIKEGRGPLFIDCTQLSEQDLHHLEKTLGYDKDTLPDYLRQRGEDLRNSPVEITVSEGMQAGPSEVAGSGVKIDKTSGSTVPGLFACGDACDANRCVHGAVTGGYRAGKSAAAYAHSLADDPVLVGDPPADKHESTFAFLKRLGGISYGEFEDIIRKIMTENVGIERNETGLEVALYKLARAKRLVNELKAGDLHELMRVHESCNLLQIAEVVIHAALFRKESRNKPYHHRLDYPATDDENWCGQVLVRKGPEDSVEVSFQPLAFGMPGQEKRRENHAAGL
jgi:adenylylsulfate reductase subunit A